MRGLSAPMYVSAVGDILGTHGAAELPADDVAGIIVQDCRQVKPAPPNNLQVSFTTCSADAFIVTGFFVIFNSN